MNRALYYACRGDREHFCSDVEAGEGRIYECLKKNKFSKEMSHEVIKIPQKKKNSKFYFTSTLIKVYDFIAKADFLLDVITDYC